MNKVLCFCENGPRETISTRLQYEGPSHRQYEGPSHRQFAFLSNHILPKGSCAFLLLPPEGGLPPPTELLNASYPRLSSWVCPTPWAPVPYFPKSGSFDITAVFLGRVLKQLASDFFLFFLYLYLLSLLLIANRSVPSPKAAIPARGGYIKARLASTPVCHP